MIIFLGILLYNHPTLSDSWLMWALLVVALGFKIYRHRSLSNRVNACVSWINDYSKSHL